MPQLPFSVDGVDTTDRDPDGAVGKDIIDSVSIAGIERVAVGEQLLNVAQTSDLEFFGLALDHFAVECVDERSGIEEQRSVGKVHVTLETDGNVA